MDAVPKAFQGLGVEVRVRAACVVFVIFWSTRLLDGVKLRSPGVCVSRGSPDLGAYGCPPDASDATLHVPRRLQHWQGTIRRRERFIRIR